MFGDHYHHHHHGGNCGMNPFLSTFRNLGGMSGVMNPYYPYPYNHPYACNPYACNPMMNPAMAGYAVPAPPPPPAFPTMCNVNPLSSTFPNSYFANSFAAPPVAAPQQCPIASAPQPAAFGFPQMASPILLPTFAGVGGATAAAPSAAAPAAPPPAAPTGVPAYSSGTFYSDQELVNVEKKILSELDDYNARLGNYQESAMKLPAQPGSPSGLPSPFAQQQAIASVGLSLRNAEQFFLSLWNWATYLKQRGRTTLHDKLEFLIKDIRGSLEAF